MITEISSDEIERLLSAYQEKIEPIRRYASFDYCFNYFQSFAIKNETSAIASKENIEMSVLQLGFYLASWGMFRGSTALLRHSSRCLIPVIKFIAATEQKHWSIDVNNYDERLIDLEQLYENIGRELKFPITKADGNAQVASAVLVTKVLLGVFGNSPAMDEFFIKGIDRSTFANSNYLEAKSRVVNIWQDLSQFYKTNHAILDRKPIHTITFDDSPSRFAYTKAKMIDMVFFEKGNEIISTEKEKKKAKEEKFI